MTEIKKTALRLKKPPCNNSEDDVPPRNVEDDSHPEKEGKKRKIDKVYAILEIEEEKGKLKELNLVQQLRRVEEIHENNKKLKEIWSRDRDGAGGTRNPAYGKHICDRITLSGLCDTVKECISVEKKELQLIEQRFEKLLAKINKEDPDDDETHPASTDKDRLGEMCEDRRDPAAAAAIRAVREARRRPLDDDDDTDKDTLEDLKKRVTDAEFKLSRLWDRVDRDAETTHFGMEKLNGRVDDLSKHVREFLENYALFHTKSYNKTLDRVDDLSKSVKDLEEWKNAAHKPKKAPEEGQVQDKRPDKRPGSRIQNRWEIHPGREVWVYSKTQRKPGVVKKVNIVKAIVNMANAEGKMTDYDVPFSLIGLRDE